MRLLLIMFAFGSMNVVVSSQDPVQVDAQHTKVEFENAQIRVLRFHLGPKERSPMHEHPERVFIFLTDAHTKVTIDNGTAEERSGKAGDMRHRSAEKHAVENLASSDYESIIIELKSAPPTETAPRR